MLENVIILYDYRDCYNKKWNEIDFVGKIRNCEKPWVEYEIIKNVNFVGKLRNDKEA